MTDIFIQSPPVLGNQYRDDAFLRGYLRRKLPPAVLQEIESELELLGSLAGGELYRLQLADRLHEPRLTQWDPWGRRIDAIELSPLWQHAAPLAAKAGLVALPYEARHGRFSRIHQFAAVYLFHPSTDVYTCPLAMTDGAARTLLNAGNPELIERAVPHLTSRDPHFAWTSGQWMTETTGGSDVGASLTTARQDEHGTWRLFGKKWFTSAVTSQMALTLARPAGNGPGGSGLAMFYVETRDRDGHLHNIRVERLKDKLGTRKVPTAELLLEGTPAILVGETRNGTRAIEPMLTITRTWNSVTSVAFMRRALALASSYARERRAFGKSISAFQVTRHKLADMASRIAAARALTGEVIARYLGGETDQSQHALLRLLTPIAKLLTAKQAVACVSEAIEAFGGAGYIEDTGIPLLLRDAQVLPIWEGTTNVLSLDALLRSDPTAGMKALLERTLNCRAAVREPHLIECAERSLAVIQKARAWLENRSDPQTTQASARRFAMTIGRGFELALLTEHAQWQLDELQDRSGMAAAMRFAWLEIDELYDVDLTDSRWLLPPKT
jgi:alkylation response protein AidB-like acyl-CoA dehydrogenase